jgi:hypothetical protein
MPAPFSCDGGLKLDMQKLSLKELLLQDTFGTMSQLALAKKPIAADDTTPNIVPALPPQQILLQCRGGPVMGDRLR